MLHHYRRFPKALRNLLVDKNIYKTGVNVKGDVTRLEKDHGLSVEGVTDLKDHKAYCMDVFGYENKRSLDYLATMQGHKSWKSKKCQMSRWSREELRFDQKEYAANDALFSARIFWGMYYRQLKFDGPIGKPKGFDEFIERPIREAREKAEEKARKKAEREAKREANRLKKLEKARLKKEKEEAKKLEAKKTGKNKSKKKATTKKKKGGASKKKQSKNKKKAATK